MLNLMFKNIQGSTLRRKKKDVDKEQSELIDFFNDLTQLIKFPISLTDATDSILKEILAKTNVESVAIYLATENKNVLRKNSYFGEYNFPDYLDTTSDIFCFKQEQIKEKLLFKKNINSNAFDFSSIVLMKILFENEEIGVIVMIDTDASSFLKRVDIEFLEKLRSKINLSFVLFFKMLEIIEKNEIEKEISIASFLQKKITYNKIPEDHRISFFVFSNSIRGINSDFTNIIPLKNGKYSVVIADVAGKGIQAVMVLLVLNTILKFSLMLTQKPEVIQSIINKFLIDTVNFENYATSLVLIIDPDKRNISFSSSAHLPLLLYKSGQKSFLEFDAEGLPLGVDKNSKYSQKDLEVDKGDIVVLATDGFFESRNENGESYSKERLKDIFVKNSKLKISDIGAKIKDDIRFFLKNSFQKDEQSLILIKFE